MSLKRLAQHVKGNEHKVAVVIGTITDDLRLLEVPKIKVCALRVSETARERILSAGGKIYTFDELFLENPTGKNTLLLRPNRNREANKHFGGAPGIKGSKVKPYLKGTSQEIKNY